MRTNFCITQTVNVSSSSVASSSRVVGLGNESNNCWCNALLQMIIHVPSIRSAVEVFANYYRHNADNRTSARHAKEILRALERYELSQQTQTPLDPSVSQAVRLAMNHFFSSISLVPEHNEDAHEALQLLMGGYEEVVRQRGIPMESLYTSMQIDRTYEPQGRPKDPDPERLARNAYTSLDAGLVSSQVHPEYQIFLNLQGKELPAFQELLAGYFYSEYPPAEPAVYLRSDGLIQDFRIVTERRQFQTPPKEVVIVLERFSFNRLIGLGTKITTPLAMPTTFQFPNDQAIYDLSFFIVHNGGFNAGHYIAYRKVDGTWLECDDSVVTPRSEAQIEDILRNAEGSPSTSYIHYYTLRAEQAPQERLSVQAGITLTPSLFPLPETRADGQMNGPSNLRLKIKAELGDFATALRRCDLNQQEAQDIHLWYQYCKKQVDLPHVDPSELQAHYVRTLEQMLENPLTPDQPFGERLFAKNAPPIIRFITQKMQNPNSVFFSQRITQAASMCKSQASDRERQALQERLQRIRALREQRLQGKAQEEVEGNEEFQFRIRRIQQMDAEQNAQVTSINNEFHAKIAPIREGVEQLRQDDLPAQEAQIMDAIQRVRRKIVQLKEGIADLNEKNAEVQARLTQVEKEQAQLQQATQELEVAIEELKEQQLDNILLNVGLMVISAVATWGLGNVLMGATLQVARAATGTVFTFALSNLDPESRKAQQRAAANTKRGPPPPVRGKM